MLYFSGIALEPTSVQFGFLKKFFFYWDLDTTHSPLSIIEIMSQFERNFLVRLIFQSSYLVVNFENKFQQKEWKKEGRKKEHDVHFSAKPTASQGPHLAEDLGESWLLSVRDWWSNSSVCCLSLCLSPLFSNVRVSLTWHFSTSSVHMNHSHCVTHSGMYHTRAAKNVWFW